MVFGLAVRPSTWPPDTNSQFRSTLQWMLCPMSFVALVSLPKELESVFRNLWTCEREFSQLMVLMLDPFPDSLPKNQHLFFHKSSLSFAKNDASKQSRIFTHTPFCRQVPHLPAEFPDTFFKITETLWDSIVSISFVPDIGFFVPVLVLVVVSRCFPLKSSTP